MFKKNYYPVNIGFTIEKISVQLAAIEAGWVYTLQSLFSSFHHLLNCW